MNGGFFFVGRIGNPTPSKVREQLDCEPSAVQLLMNRTADEQNC
jgi:hypothetical protein